MAVAEEKKTVETLKDIYFVYSSVSEPKKQLNKDNKPPESDDPLEMHSYEIKVLMTEDRFKKWKKPFKGAKNITNAKDFDVDEVFEKFGLVVDDDMVLVKFSQTALVGKPKAVEGSSKTTRARSYPIRQIGIKGKVQDLFGNTIDQDTKLGNCTKGHFQFRPVESDFGLYLYPAVVCVTELVPFTGGGQVEIDEEELGIEELDDADLEGMEDESEEPKVPEDEPEIPEEEEEAEEPVKKAPAKRAPRKRATKASTVEAEEISDDGMFDD